jgi:hypothetical protein
MRLRIVAALIALAIEPAQAGLVGAGDNTVIPYFWLDTTNPPPSPPPVPPPSPPPTVPSTFCQSNPCEIPNYAIPPPGNSTNFPPPTIPADFVQGSVSEVTIHVGDTQIVITNQLAGSPLCSVATTPCPDPFTGFAFTFSSGVDIKSVTVDSGSSPDFLPNDTAPHDGLQLISPTYFVVDVTGDVPLDVGDKLVLDLQFPGPPAVPELSTWALMLVGFAGLGFAGYRRMQRAASSA